MNDNVSGSIVSNKGLLKYSIDFGTNKNNFTINTILRNLGITDKDGNAVWADSLKYNDSGAEKDRDKNNALQIKGGENFFRETSGNNITRFSLKADSEIDSELATEMKKLEYCDVDGVESENFKKFYDDYNSSTQNDDSYNGKLRNNSYTLTVDDLKELKSEAERLIPIAENCVTALGDDASNDLKTLLDYAKRFNNSVTGDNCETLSVQVPEGITSTISNNDKNRGKLLFASIDSSTQVIQESVYIAINKFSKLTAIRASEDYQQIADKYEELKSKDSSFTAGRQAFHTLCAETLTANDSGCKAEDITTLVCDDKFSYESDFNLYIFYEAQQNTNSSIFGWSINYKQANLNQMVSSDFNGKINCFKDDNSLKYYYCYASSGGYEYYFLKKFTNEVASLLPNKNIQTPLTLHTTPTTTDENASQTENTYQIFETTNQKLYWGGTKLTIEIPIDLPEQTADNSKITAIQIYQDYKNEEFLATQTASE